MGAPPEDDGGDGRLVGGALDFTAAMENSGRPPVCLRCRRPVEANRRHFETFERMHWLCFHLEYEHSDADPDRPCGDPNCPWRRIERLEGWLALLGHDPQGSAGA